MKTFLTLTIILFLSGCGGDSVTQDNTTPPQPTVGGNEIQPPASPTLE